MGNGYFVISLDFELLWGVLDVSNCNEYQKNVNGVWEVVPKLLQLFKEYSISATWGVVGMMFNNDKKELLSNIPSLIPTYVNPIHSNYNYFDNINNSNYNYYFAPTLISQILQVPNQELGTHTYSHYYCTEKGQTIEQFEADIKMAKKVANDKGYNSPVSLIFPRNMCNSEYIEILKRNGIVAYRGNPHIWTDKIPKSWKIIIRGFRLLDSYINLTGYHCISLSKSNVPLNISASCFFRHATNFKILERLKLRRIKKQMKYAAKHGKVFHIWWHPHNFGLDPNKNIDQIKEILEYYNVLKNKYNFQSVNMKNLGGIYYENSDACRNE